MKKNIIKGTLILTFTGLLIKFLGFLYKIYLSRTIGAFAIGIYQLTLPVITLCHAVSIAGIEITLSKTTAFYQKNAPGMLKKNATVCSMISIILSTLSGGIVCLFSDVIATYFLKNRECSKIIRIIAISLPFNSIHAMFYSYNIGKENSTLPALSQLFEQLIRFLSLFIISKKIKGTEVAVLSALAGEIASVIFCFAFIKLGKLKKEYFKYPPSMIKNIIKSAFPISLNRICLNIIQSVEIALLPLMLQMYGMSKTSSLSTLGVISAMALPVILLPATLISSFSLMLLPSASKNRHNPKIMKKYITKSCYCSVLYGLFCFFVMKYIMAKYTGIIFNSMELPEYVRRLSFMYPCLFINITLKTILNSVDKSINVLINNMVCEFICLIFIVAVVPKQGVDSYILGIIISQSVCTFMNIMSSGKYLNEIADI